MEPPRPALVVFKNTVVFGFLGFWFLGGLAFKNTLDQPPLALLHCAQRGWQFSV
jgi:hypothetical protein